ncbi:MAG TPA: hypothetical protein VHS09_14015 [Polyangiaceae bacterium]|nr:hypothetical protein [Polyangiaceae bacterium]
MRRALAAGGLALAAACGPSRATPDTGPAAWHVVLEERTPVLLSAWGTAPDDVFAVGGPLGNGTPSAVLHYDGASWTDLHASGTDTFWWAHGTGRADVWFVGTSGRITHWDGTTLTDVASGTTATLFGVWAASPSDVWAVGGTPDGGASAPNDVVLHFDGTSFTPAPLPQALGRAFFKVWGTASDDLYVVGEYGTIWHRTGTTWALEANAPPLATGNLTTVNGCSATEIYAVGGEDVLVRDGAGWSRANVTLENGVNGVSCAAPGNVAIVGFGGLKQRLVAGEWASDFASAPHDDLHAVWADGAGGFWAVGGDFVSDPQPGAARAGVLAYYGTASVGTTVAP